jgi:hypothetical protein
MLRILKKCLEFKQFIFIGKWISGFEEVEMNQQAQNMT